MYLLKYVKYVWIARSARAVKIEELPWKAMF